MANGTTRIAHVVAATRFGRAALAISSRICHTHLMKNRGLPRDRRYLTSLGGTSVERTHDGATITPINDRTFYLLEELARPPWHHLLRPPRPRPGERDEMFRVWTGPRFYS